MLPIPCSSSQKERTPLPDKHNALRLGGCDLDGLPLDHTFAVCADRIFSGWHFRQQKRALRYRIEYHLSVFVFDLNLDVRQILVGGAFGCKQPLERVVSRKLFYLCLLYTS